MPVDPSTQPGRVAPDCQPDVNRPSRMRRQAHVLWYQKLLAPADVGSRSSIVTQGSRMLSSKPRRSG